MLRIRVATIRPVQDALAVTLTALLVITLFGCTTTIRCRPAQPNAQTVYLIDYGYTSSLVLPKADGPGMVYYAYGDWDYYARMQRGLLSGVHALVWPTRGTLGRGELPAVASPAELRRRVDLPIEHIHRFQAEPEAIARLRRELARQFQSHAEQSIENPVHKMTFVPLDQRYHLLDNSNMQVARWIKQLGCEVSDEPIFSRWRVEPAGPP